MKLIKTNFILIIIFIFIASLGFSVAKKAKTSAGTDNKSAETSSESSGSSASKYIFCWSVRI